MYYIKNKILIHETKIKRNFPTNTFEPTSYYILSSLFMLSFLDLETRRKIFDIKNIGIELSEYKLISISERNLTYIHVLTLIL